MSEYTKGEWVVGFTYDERGWPVYRLRDMQDPKNPSEAYANAKRIELCCNCHDDLLKMCKYVLNNAIALSNTMRKGLQAAIAKAHKQSVTPRSSS